MAEMCLENKDVTFRLQTKFLLMFTLPRNRLVDYFNFNKILAFEILKFYFHHVSDHIFSVFNVIDEVF